MKKLFVIGLAVLMIFGLTTGMAVGQGSSDVVNFDLSLEMMEYIESVPNPISWFLGTTHYTSSYGPPRLEIHVSNGWDIAYANCPFSVTMSGDNPADHGIPRFARWEEGPNGAGYDVVPTIYNISLGVNGGNLPLTDWFDGASQFPITTNYDEAPHNGQIRMDMTVEANGTTTPDPGCPVREVSIDPTFTWQDSADAGTYSCTLVATFTAL